MSTLNPAPKERVKWEQHEIDLLAEAVVEARVRDPFQTGFALFEQAQKDVLDAHRRREIPGWQAISEVKTKVATLWKARMEAAAPEPQIVHVETQRPPDYVDMLQQLDTPSLVAMLVSKIGKELDAFKPMLSLLNSNGTSEQIGAPHNPPVSLLVQASAKPRKTRVAMLGMTKSEFMHISDNVAEQKIPVELLFVDTDKRTQATLNADYVIAMKFVSHTASGVYENALPKGRFFHLRDGGITSAVQKLRDIGSMLPPRA